MALSINDIDDLILMTRDHFFKGKGFNTIFAEQGYPFMDTMLQKGRMKIDGGDSITFPLHTGADDSAHFTSLYAQDEYTITNSLLMGTAPWRHVNTNWAFERREALINKGNAKKLKDIIDARRLSALQGLCDLIESAAWTKPATSADELTPWGLTYWVTKGTTGNRGFLGLNPTGFTDCAGIDASDSANQVWRNYSARGAGNYTAIDRTLITTMRRTYNKLSFRAPALVGDLAASPRLRDFRIYTNFETELALQNLAEDRNENLGFDFGPQGVTFKRTSIVPVSVLDDDTADPLYFIDHDCFGVIALEGDHLHEEKPRMHPTKHNTRVVDIDSTFNIVCRNRRKQGVISK